jgi:hypothetical protein
MLLYRPLVIIGMLLSLTACKQDRAATAPAPKLSGNAVFVDTSGLSQYKDVSAAVLAELEKNKDIRLVSDRRDASIYLGVNAIVPEEINELSKSNFVVLSYVLVNFDNKNATEGLGMGQRNLLEPFVTNVTSVLSSFIKQPAPEAPKK